MTAVPVTTVPLYENLGLLYGTELVRHGVRPAMLTHKWQGADLLAPYSDVDVRILLDGPPQDWLEWNKGLAAAHSAVVARDPLNRRLLEHPPGFAFTVPELRHRRVSPPEVATWTLIHGHAPSLQRWKAHAQMVPWSGLDERFYRAILEARLDGRYRLADDSTDNVIGDTSGYRRHCVSWHYLAPCWFAAAALATRTRCPGKTAALTQWRPAGLERYAGMFLRCTDADEAQVPPREPAVRDLLRAAHAALDAAMRHVPAPAEVSESPEDEEAQAMAWTMTAGMLRVRVARWLYYLDPPPGVATGYLIAREAKELRAAVSALRSMAADGGTERQRLADRMAELLPSGPTTSTVLREALATWRRERPLIEDFLSFHAS